MSATQKEGTIKVCSTVGDIKKAIANLPDDMPIECGFDTTLEFSVYKDDGDGEEYLDISGF